jgi:hypothetical protein
MSNPSLLCVPYRFKTSKLYSQIPDSGLGDFVVTRATTPTAGQATRVNAAGLIELVADNVPRLDYPLGGITAGCPALLVEPLAQNQIQQSEDFTAAFHTKFNLNAFGSGSVANTTATRDPYGTNLADYIQENSAASVVHGIIDIFAGNVSGTTYTLSVFAKAAERTIINLFNNAGGGGNANFNLITGIATLTAGVSASMQNYGNGWWRCILTYTSSITGNHNVQIRLCDASGNTTYNGTGNQGAYIFGAQLETGSAATSYIPTAASPVTRGAEVVDRTGISSLMGQTEGTFYLDMSYFAKGSTGATLWLYIIGTPTSNNIGLGVGVTSVRSIVNGQSDSLSTPSTANGVKIAWGYNGSGVVCFVNGVQYNLPNGGNQIITSMNRCVIDMSSAGGTRMADVRIRAVTLYPTRLPNTGPNSLQSLTQ